MQLFPGVRIDHRWSGQVIETNDGLPYIGETARNQFAATGYCGNGITFGTIAAVMAHDAISGKFNPWRDLYDINRTSGLRVHESGMKLAHPTEESQLKAGSKGEMVKSSKVVPLVANN